MSCNLIQRFQPIAHGGSTGYYLFILCGSQLCLKVHVSSCPNLLSLTLVCKRKGSLFVFVSYYHWKILRFSQLCCVSYGSPDWPSASVRSSPVRHQTFADVFRAFGEGSWGRPVCWSLFYVKESRKLFRSLAESRQGPGYLRLAESHTNLT